MMMRIVLALIVFTSVVAADDRVNAIAPRRNDCKPNGAVWVALAEKDSTPKSAQSTTRLYGNGAVTITHTRGSTSEVENLRCVREYQMKDVEEKLKLVTSKTVEVKRKVPCKTTSKRWTVITVFDKEVFVERECNPVALERKSEQALKSVRAHMQPPKRDCDNNPLAKGC